MRSIVPTPKAVNAGTASPSRIVMVMRQMNNKTWTAIILVLVMILVPWTSMLNGSELDENSRPAWATGSSTSAADTGLNLSSPNATHGSDANLNLTNVSGMESVLFLLFEKVFLLFGKVFLLFGKVFLLFEKCSYYLKKCSEPIMFCSVL